MKGAIVLIDLQSTLYKIKIAFTLSRPRDEFHNSSKSFLETDCYQILQSDIGRKFTTIIIKKLYNCEIKTSLNQI